MSAVDNIHLYDPTTDRSRVLDLLMSVHPESGKRRSLPEVIDLIAEVLRAEITENQLRWLMEREGVAPSRTYVRAVQTIPWTLRPEDRRSYMAILLRAVQALMEDREPPGRRKAPAQALMRELDAAGEVIDYVKDEEDPKKRWVRVPRRDDDFPYARNPFV